MVAGIRNRADHSELGPSDSDVSPRQNASHYGTIETDIDTEPELSRDITPAKPPPVLWRNLPNKGQVAVLVIARLSEPLVQTSFQSYMFYQLKSFDRTLPDSVIAGQAGVMQASFKAGQLMTAMVWGTVADSDWAGRKTVIMIGLLGTMISCVGFGFATQFWQALCFRIMGGALNGNVPVMRTMISEMIREKRFQSRAFLLLPMVFNIGSIIGPLLGGVLADPASNYPDIFGEVQWMIKYPYALPNLVSAGFMLWSASLVFFGLEETLESIQHKQDWGIKCSRKFAKTAGILIRRSRKTQNDTDSHRPVESGDESQTLLANNNRRSTIHGNRNHKKATRKLRYTQKLPFGRIFTPNVINTLGASAIIGIYLGAFNPLWLIFLSTAVADPAIQPQHPPFIFSGGLGMPPRQVGFAMALLGAIGITLQLFVYPTLTHTLGIVRCWRISLYCFPIAAILVPFLALVPSNTPSPAGKDGFPIWAALSAVLMIQVVGRVFVGPATAILINNSSPHPSALARMHGIAQTVASAVRTVSPIVAGWLYGVGLSHGLVGAVWWGLAFVALCACVASNWIREGNGHEIWLEGDAEENEVEV